MKDITVEISANGYTGLTTENIEKALVHYFGAPSLKVSFSVREITQGTTTDSDISEEQPDCEHVSSYVETKRFEYCSDCDLLLAQMD